MSIPWRHEEASWQTHVTSDSRIPRDEVEAVREVIEAVNRVLGIVLEDTPLGEPEVRIVMMRWKAGASALIAEPAHDPVLVLAAMWNGLTATVDSLGVPVEEFVATMLDQDKEDGDADPR